jgi:hypothetical protein
MPKIARSLKTIRNAPSAKRDSLLSDLAEQLAALMDVEGAVDHAGGLAGQKGDRTLQGATARAFLLVAREASRRREALQAAILDQQPQSLSETLSILKIAALVLDRIVLEQDFPIEVSKEVRAVLGALNAAVICLQQAEVSSPLRRHDVLHWPQSWPEQVEIAHAAARRIAKSPRRPADVEEVVNV